MSSNSGGEHRQPNAKTSRCHPWASVILTHTKTDKVKR